MKTMDERFPSSIAFLSLVPLRIPAGWLIAINSLDDDRLHPDLTGYEGTIFHALNAGNRFVLDVEARPDDDLKTLYTLTVEYEPWARDERGRRLPEKSFHLSGAAELVDTFNTANAKDLLARLEYWIARCTVWVKEGN